MTFLSDIDAELTQNKGCMCVCVCVCLEVQNGYIISLNASKATTQYKAVVQEAERASKVLGDESGQSPPVF